MARCIWLIAMAAPVRAIAAINVIRRFNMQTGAPAGETRIEKSTGFNDIAVTANGTIYGTVTGSGDGAQLWKVLPDGTASILVQGAPLVQPNGVALDPQGNIVVVNIGNPDVITFSADGKVVAYGEGRAERQRRIGDHAGRHQVREQRHSGRRLADSPGSGS